MVLASSSDNDNNNNKKPSFSAFMALMGEDIHSTDSGSDFQGYSSGDDSDTS